MSTADRLLQRLDPPPGGWQRLLDRREPASSWRAPLAALACSLAALAVALLQPQRHRVELKLNGARLLGEHSQGITLSLLDSQRTVALPSSDPNVRLYWIEPGNQNPESDHRNSGAAR